MDFVLYPIIKSAADFLVSSDLKRLKQCADDFCGWLFMDKSRNYSRRWCSMKDCGNRAKAHRHYQRKCQEKNKKNRRRFSVPIDKIDYLEESICQI